MLVYILLSPKVMQGTI